MNCHKHDTLITLLDEMTYNPSHYHCQFIQMLTLDLPVHLKSSENKSHATRILSFCSFQISCLAWKKMKNWILCSALHNNNTRTTKHIIVHNILTYSLNFYIEILCFENARFFMIDLVLQKFIVCVGLSALFYSSNVNVSQTIE